MMKYSLFLLSLFFTLLISCNKTEDKGPESQVQAEKKGDSIQVETEPLKDTFPQKLNKINLDSLKALKEKKKKPDSLKVLKDNEVILLAYYFHPTARCITCRNIEAYSYEAIQRWEEKNKRKIMWKELNIEDSVNEHYIDEYSLQFSSLVIVKYVGGEKEKWKNLEETWKLVNDKSTFIKYVTHELNKIYKEN